MKGKIVSAEIKCPKCGYKGTYSPIIPHPDEGRIIGMHPRMEDFIDKLNM